MGGFNMFVSVEVFRFDAVSGKLTSNIIQKFTDIKKFTEFYNEWKTRDAQIVVRNYNPDESPDLKMLYDRIIVGPENVTYLKLEKKQL